MSQSRSSLQDPVSPEQWEPSPSLLPCCPPDTLILPCQHRRSSTPAWELNCLSIYSLWLPCVLGSVVLWLVLMGKEWVFSSLSSPSMPLLLAAPHLHLVFKLLAPAQRMPCPFRGSEGCCTTPAFLSKWPWGNRMEEKEDPHRENSHSLGLHCLRSKSLRGGGMPGPCLVGNCTKL